MGKVIKGSKVLLMGLTYKENVADTREIQVKEIIKELKEFGVDIFGYDPLLDSITEEFDIKALTGLDNVSGIDCIILTVTHNIFREVTLAKLKDIMNANPILIDVRGFFDSRKAVENRFYYRTL